MFQNAHFGMHNGLAHDHYCPSHLGHSHLRTSGILQHLYGLHEKHCGLECVLPRPEGLYHIDNLQPGI